jgi:hypothetical protein
LAGDDDVELVTIEAQRRRRHNGAGARDGDVWVVWIGYWSRRSNGRIL